MAIRFLNALNIDGTVTATINADANNAYDGILVSTSGLIERRTKAQILSDIGAGTMSSFTVAADTNTATTTISNSDTLSILGGTGVSTVSNPDGTITINASGSSYTKWVLAGDTGTDQDINDGDTATFKGIDGIVTNTKATDTIEIGFPIASLTAATVAGTDLVAIADVNDSDAIRKVTAQSIADLAPQGDITEVQASTAASEEGIKVTDGTGPIPKVGLDIIVQTNIGAGNLADADEFIVHDSTATKNLAVTFKNLKDQIASAVGDITGIDAGAGIVVNDPTTTTPEVAVDYSATGVVFDANSGTSVTLADADTILVQDANGSAATAVVKIPLSKIKTYIGAGTYTWSIEDSGGNTEAIGSGDQVLFSANTGLAAEVSSTPEVQISLKLDELNTVTTIDPAADFLVGVDGTANEKILYQNVHLDQWGAAEADVDFGTNKLTNVKNGSLASDGVNLGQVESLISGSSLFRGGYNANTGLTTDLGAGNGAINGASNIATALGDFYAVTVAGTQLGVALEPGDLIFANTAIDANTNPANSLFTIVQSGQSIAGAGGTDGATTKGVAGFDNDNFTVSTNGWVQLKTRSTAGSYGSASKTVSLTIDDDGITTAAAQQDIDITASQVSDFCSAVSTCISSNEQYTETVGGAISIDVNHELGTRDVIVQLYDASSYDTVYADVTRTDADNINLSFTSAPSANDIRVLIQKVS